MHSGWTSMFFIFAPLEGPSQHSRSNDNAKANSTAATKGPPCFLLDLHVFPILRSLEGMAMPKPTPQLPQKDLHVFHFCAFGRAKQPQ